MGQLQEASEHKQQPLGISARSYGWRFPARVTTHARAGLKGEA